MSHSVKRLERRIKSATGIDVTGEVVAGSIRLTGETDCYDAVVKAGQIAAKSRYAQVINDIAHHDPRYPVMPVHTVQKQEGNLATCDVLVIGAGIIGSAISRELSKYELAVVMADKAYDVAVHTSSRNDGMVHPGIASKWNSLKTKMNVRGNALYHKVSEELEVPIRWCGSSILFRSHLSKVIYPLFWIKAKVIGMPGLRYMNKRAVYEAEPYLSEGVVWGVMCESAGVTSPYKMTVAYAENAIKNGVKLMLHTEVVSMAVRNEEITEVHTDKGTIRAKLVINAAGVYSDCIAGMAGDRFFSIHPRKGDIVLFDKKKGKYVQGILGFIGDRSSQHTKGGGVIKTYEGNILVGPNAIEIPYRENYQTRREDVMQLLRQKLPQIKGVDVKDDITYFTGIRAATYKEDFIIEASKKVKNLIHVAGIQSPGFAAAPAIAERVEELVKSHFQNDASPLRRKTNWEPKRKGIPDVAHLTYEAREALIRENPDYGEVICRCEEISKGEIIDALKGPIPITSTDAVKRRVRAGMGRCQGGFCMPLVMEIIHDVNGIAMEDITKKEGASRIAVAQTKGDRIHESSV